MRKLIVLVLLAALLGVIVAACAPAATPAPTAAPATAAPKATAAPSGMDALVAAAKAEGQLTTIALPHDWCNYGGVLDAFKAKYGLKVNELNPDAASGEEVEAIKANKDNKGPQAPDVIDVGISFGASIKADKLVQPYKVATWDTIPDNVKDPEGYWYEDYFGVMSIEVNTDVVKNAPKDWADLTKPEYKGQIALAGDPKSSSQGYNAVVLMSMLNGGKIDDPTAGLNFFATLGKAGNLVPVKAKQGNIAKGETPIVFRWDYNALADRDALKGNPNIAVIVPSTTVLAGPYVQAISAYAPHPNAAKLWEEFLYSDEGQLIWLNPPGYCHPIRYNDLAKRGKIPAELVAKLPSADLYAKAIFPTPEQIAKSADVISKNWDSVVGITVK